MDQVLGGKTALVTGGTRGVGRGVAIGLAMAGAKVAICGRDEAEGKAVLSAIETGGGTARFIKADVSKSAEVDGLIEEIVSRFGQLDIAFNNAGGASTFKPLHETTEEEYDYVFDGNVRGLYLCMRAEIRQMLKQASRGSIINNTSIQGHVAIAHSAHYTASKHAAEGYTKLAALDYAKLGIRVNAVAPGVLGEGALGGGDLPDEFKNYLIARHPMGRFGTSGEVAGAVIFLASDAAAFITGASLPVDGGYLIE